MWRRLDSGGIWPDIPGKPHRGFYVVPVRNSRFQLFAFLSVQPDAWRMDTTLGKRIKRLREQRRWTQAELGNLVGVTTKTVSNWESGRNDPRSSIGALESVFKTSLDDDVADTTTDEVMDALTRSQLIGWRQRKVQAEYERHLHEQAAEEARQGSA